jgi:hypothetical protein
VSIVHILIVKLPSDRLMAHEPLVVLEDRPALLFLAGVHDPICGAPPDLVGEELLCANQPSWPRESYF